MKLRFLLITMCLFAVMSKTQAQWSDQYSVIETKNAKNSNITTVTTSGDVLVAGTFTQEFSFGAYDLEPVAKSTYLAKYNAAGTKQWAVAFAGAATPTAMTTDDSGNIYIAGIYADKVVFNSTDNNSQEITGISDMFGDIITDQGAGFIAKYSPDGVLLKVQEYKPGPFEEAFFYYYLQDLQFKVEDLKFSGNKLYASVLYTGKTNSNGFDLNGSYIIQEGFLFVEAFAGAIIEFNLDNLSINLIYAKLTPQENSLQADVANVRLAISDNELFGAFYVKGGQPTLSTNGLDQTIAFSQETDTIEFGHVFTKINLSTGSLQSNFSGFSKKNRDFYYKLEGLYLANNKLILSGQYTGQLIFKPELVSAGTSDVFVAALDATNTGTVNFAIQSGTADTKVFASSTLKDNQLVVACNETSKSGILTTDLTDGSTKSYIQKGDNVLTNAVYSGNGKVVTVEALLGATNEDLAATIVTVENQSSSIQAPDRVSAVTIAFNTTSNILTFSETADASIYNSVGALVRTISNSQSIDLSDLSNGIYIVSAQTLKGAGQLKFAKK